MLKCEKSNFNALWSKYAGCFATCGILKSPRHDNGGFSFFSGGMYLSRSGVIAISAVDHSCRRKIMRP